MLADVAQGRGAQEGVGDGVQHHVGVGVAEQAAGVVDPHAAQDQGASLHQSMRVVPQSHPHEIPLACQCDPGFRFDRPARRRSRPRS